MENKKLKKVVKKVVGNSGDVGSLVDDVIKSSGFVKDSLKDGTNKFNNVHKVDIDGFKNLRAVDAGYLNRSTNSTGRGNYRYVFDKNADLAYIVKHNASGSYKPVQSFN